MSGQGGTMLDTNSDAGFMTADGRKIGGVAMEMRNITLRFGGVVAIKDISFDIRWGKSAPSSDPMAQANRPC